MDRKQLRSQTSRGFRGLSLQASLFDALESGEMSPSEFVVYCVVDSLNGTKGCYATNAYLAKKCNMSVRSISSHLNSLIYKEFLFEEYLEDVDSKRTIRTYFREIARKKKKEFRR